MSNPNERHFTVTNELIAISAILLLTTLFQLFYLDQYFGRVPYAGQPINDAKTYWTMGIEVYRQGWLLSDEGAYYQAPLYPYFLAIIRLFGFHLYIEHLYIQTAISVLNGIVCYAVARQFLTIRFAVLAAMAFSINPLTFVFGSKTLATALGLTLWLGFAACQLLWISKKRWHWVTLSALLYGLSLICQPFLLFTLPFLPFIYLSRKPHGNSFFIKPFNLFLHKHSVPYFMIVMLLLFAVTLRNYAVSGEWVFITANSGVTLYMGNNEDAIGGLAPVKGLSDDIETQYSQSIELASQLAGENLSPAQASSFWVKKTLAWIAANPIDWLLLECKKLLWAFHRIPPAVNYSTHFEGEWLSWIVPLQWLSGIIMAAGLVGFVFLLRKPDPRTLFMALMMMGYVLLSLVYYSSDRFLSMFYPFIAIIAIGLIERRSKCIEYFTVQKKWTIPAAIILAGLVFNPSLSSYSTMENAYGWYNLGVMAKDGIIKTTDELMCYENALKHYPNLPSALLNLGVIYAQGNRLDESNRLFERLLQIMPQHEMARRNLAINYERQGRFDEAQQLNMAND